MPSLDEGHTAPQPDPRDELDLDPRDWIAVRAQAHSMLDDILDFMEGIRARPVWRPIPPAIRASLRERLPVEGQPLRQIHAEFMADVLPYAGGNLHPRFLGLGAGRGNPGRHAGRDARRRAELQPRRTRPHAHRVEREVSAGPPAPRLPEPAPAGFWSRRVVRQFRRRAHRQVSGARAAPRSNGGARGERLVAYTSVASHGCIPRALEMSGLGRTRSAGPGRWRPSHRSGGEGARSRRTGRGGPSVPRDRRRRGRWTPARWTTLPARGASQKRRRAGSTWTELLARWACSPRRSGP